MFKEQKGITLVALVVTIIVLLILAGVSISLVLGQNGVLTQASTAVSSTNIAKVTEEVNLALSSMESDYWADWATNTDVQRSKHYTNVNLQRYLSGDVTYLKGTTIAAADEAPLAAGTYEVVYSNVKYDITFEVKDGGLIAIAEDGVEVQTTTP